MGGKTSAKVKNAWNREAYDRIAVMVQKGEKDAYKEAAKQAGMSLNAWIVEAMEEKRRARRTVQDEQREQ